MSGHVWSNPKKGTTWVCSECGASRVSSKKPFPHIRLMPEKPHMKRGMRGPSPSERGLTCDEMKNLAVVSYVHGS
jgi:hypothetical protein